VRQKKSVQELHKELPPAFKFDDPEFEIEVSQRAGAAAKSKMISANFDVAFVIDKTGSMRSYIQSCKEWSYNTAKAIQAQLGDSINVSLRMAVIFYSGYCCESGPEAKVVGFGTPEQISRLTAGEKTEGGCGSGED
jgi:hypothetical protein